MSDDGVSGLEELWAEADALLPAGAYVADIRVRYVHTTSGLPVEWVADATWNRGRWAGGIEGKGRTPVLAMRDLIRNIEAAS